MSAHPLIDLANEADVKATGSFREVAGRLTGAQLADAYHAEREAAAAEAGGELSHFVEHTGEVEDEAAVTEAEMAIAISNQCQGDSVPLHLPNEIDVHLLAYKVPLTTLAARKIKARMRVTAAADLIGVAVEEGEEDRLAVCRLRLMPPKSTKGDTPLRAFLEGLAVCATVEGWRTSLAAQMAERFEKTVSEKPPVLVVLANNRYWEIWRRRSLKSAGAWMATMGRLGEAVEESAGVTTSFSSIRLYGDPPWRVRQGKPVLDAEPRLTNGLEPNAGELRSRSKARALADNPIIEADYAKPVRSYSVRELYEPGDRVNHPTLGEGIVQKALGPNKVEVRFGEAPKVLVQGRL